MLSLLYDTIINIKFEGKKECVEGGEGRRNISIGCFYTKVHKYNRYKEILHGIKLINKYCLYHVVFNQAVERSNEKVSFPASLNYF